jgi:hypothetical protein
MCYDCMIRVHLAQMYMHDVDARHNLEGLGTACKAALGSIAREAALMSRLCNYSTAIASPDHVERRAWQLDIAGLEARTFPVPSRFSAK